MPKKKKTKNQRIKVRPTKRAVLHMVKESVVKDTDTVQKTRIRVIGIGGGGGNIVSEMSKTVSRADFISANTDEQAQRVLPREVRTFSFGEKATSGLGCGMDALLG